MTVQRFLFCFFLVGGEEGRNLPNDITNKNEKDCRYEESYRPVITGGGDRTDFAVVEEKGSDPEIMKEMYTKT